MAPPILDHVAIGVHRVADAASYLVGALGARPRSAGPGDGFRFWQWSFAGGGVMEILEPDGPPGGFLHRFLEARGPGLHHVTFKVPDLRAATDRAEALGQQVVGYNDLYPGWKEAFLHPRRAQGIVVQLAEADASLEPEGDGDAWPFPSMPEPAAEAATLVGLRLATRDLERARRQWEELLDGACEEVGDTLVYRWPDSPLRIAVSADPDGPEGPRAVELSAGPRVALPEGPHPALGIPFASPREW